jgi:hypothetical protein
MEGVCYFTSSQKGDKTGCNNYLGISLPSASSNILSVLILSSLSPYVSVDEITGDYQCGF